MAETVYSPLDQERNPVRPCQDVHPSFSQFSLETKFFHLHRVWLWLPEKQPTLRLLFCMSESEPQTATNYNPRGFMKPRG